jgi:hypothetical protein
LKTNIHLTLPTKLSKETGALLKNERDMIKNVYTLYSNSGNFILVKHNKIYDSENFDKGKK